MPLFPKRHIIGPYAVGIEPYHNPYYRRIIMPGKPPSEGLSSSKGKEFRIVPKWPWYEVQRRTMFFFWRKLHSAVDLGTAKQFIQNLKDERKLAALDTEIRYY
jgi:hypothetical protein